MTMEDDLKKYETLLIINELSEVIKYHTTALEQLGEMVSKGISPFTSGQLEAMRNHLRDNQNILLREFNGLQQGGRANKTYDKRYVCSKCSSVFMMPLPDGLCDECRVKAVPNAYDRFKKSKPPTIEGDYDSNNNAAPAPDAKESTAEED